MHVSCLICQFVGVTPAAVNKKMSVWCSAWARTLEKVIFADVTTFIIIIKYSTIAVEVAIKLTTPPATGKINHVLGLNYSGLS